MKKPNHYIKNLNIIKFSRINSGIMILAIVLSILSQTYLFNEIKQLNEKRFNAAKGYDLLHEFKFQTELFLTSYDLEENKRNLHQSYTNYLEGFALLQKTVKINDSLLNYHEIVKIKYNGLNEIVFNNKQFSEKNLMNEPILVRLGALSRDESNSDFFILLKSFFEKVEHFKQYQDFLLEDMLEIKNQVHIETAKAIDSLNYLFILLPIIIFFAAVVLSIIVDKAIESKEFDLISTKLLLENILNSIPMRIFWKDKNGIYLGANKLFVEDANLDSVNDLIGKNDFELPWKDTEAKLYVEDDKAVLSSKKAKLNIMETQTTADGSFIHVKTSKVPLIDKKNEVYGVLGIYDDITEYLQTKEKIKAQEVQIIHQNKLVQMGEMISMIAHQWRQPLTAISTIAGGLTRRYQKGKLDEETLNDKVNNIVLQTNHLSETINDFRNFFKPEKNISNITSAKLIEETLNIVGIALENENIQIKKEFSCDNELSIYVNELKHVLLNIIKNAQDVLVERGIKDPYISIKTFSTMDSKCAITIEDNGGGIPKEIMNKIFDPYFSTKEKNGTGLGLYMSKIIVEEHSNGTLSVSSKDGKTIFKIVI